MKIELAIFKVSSYKYTYKRQFVPLDSRDLILIGQLEIKRNENALWVSSTEVLLSQLMYIHLFPYWFLGDAKNMIK